MSVFVCSDLACLPVWSPSCVCARVCVCVCVCVLMAQQADTFYMGIRTLFSPCSLPHLLICSNHKSEVTKPVPDLFSPYSFSLLSFPDCLFTFGESERDRETSGSNLKLFTSRSPLGPKPLLHRCMAPISLTKKGLCSWIKVCGVQLRECVELEPLLCLPL